MLVLFETAAGYCLFKVLDSGKVKESGDLSEAFATPDKAGELVKLKDFCPFEDTTQALAGATSIVDGKLDKTLKKFLKKSMVEKELKDKLVVSDHRLGGIIKEKMGIKCVYESAMQELFRGIRSQIESLISGISPAGMHSMQLGLSHSLSRYKLKFSPDKVDTMIVQAIALLDDIDKELNTYAMRAREWYGCHFPELSKIVTDNIAFAKTVKVLGMRESIDDAPLSDCLPEDVENDVREAAKISMGTEISEDDVDNIRFLCDQVVELHDYRSQLYEYLKNRMGAIAPNLTVMVGELVGARLIARAGSLLNLAKQPASTVQILGAEKALFRALKTKHATPKYGLIYHASLVGQAHPEHKGKISRVLAAKTSIACRIDALGEDESADVGLENRNKVENRLRQLEGKKTRKLGGAKVRGQEGPKKVNLNDTSAYNTAADSTMAEIVELAKEAGAAGKKKRTGDNDDVSTPKAKKEKKGKKEGDVKSDKKKKAGKRSREADDDEDTPKKAKKSKKPKKSD